MCETSRATPAPGLQWGRTERPDRLGKEPVISQTHAISAVDGWISDEYRDVASNPSRVGEIRAALDEHGIVELPGLLRPDARALLAEQILALEGAASRSDAGGNRKFSIKGDKLSDTVVGRLAQSAFMRELVNRLLGPVDGRPALVDPAIRSDEIIPGISLMRGPGDVTAYHFDGSYLNLIFPVIVPKLSGPRRGQLVIYPNLRPFEKTFWSTKAIPALLRASPLRRLWKRREIDYREDTVYAFYGYRSYHGVESPAEAALRCITNMTVGRPRF